MIGFFVLHASLCEMKYIFSCWELVGYFIHWPRKTFYMTQFRNVSVCRLSDINIVHNSIYWDSGIGTCRGVEFDACEEKFTMAADQNYRIMYGPMPARVWRFITIRVLIGILISQLSFFLNTIRENCHVEWKTKMATLTLRLLSFSEHSTDTIAGNQNLLIFFKE